MSYYLKAMKNYFRYEGRSSRKEYWLFILFSFVFWFLANIIDIIVFSNNKSVISIVVIAIHIIPSIMISIRRLHDLDLTGWVILISCIPFVGNVIFIILTCTFGTNGDNKYGASLASIEGYEKTNFVRKFFKFSIGMFIANIIYLVGFVGINFSTLVNIKNNINEELVRQFFVGIGIYLFSLISILVISGLMYLYIAKELKKESYKKHINLFFNVVNGIVSLIFIVLSILFFVNITYYETERPELYEYREVEYKENTSNFKKYKELKNKLDEKINYLLIKYDLGSFYSEKIKNADEKVLDSFVSELNVTLEDYKNFVKSNNVVFPNKLTLSQVNYFKDDRVFYKIVVSSSALGLSEGNLSEEKLKKYLDLWEVFSWEVQNKNPRTIDLVMNMAKADILCRLFTDENTIINQKDTLLLKKPVKNIKNNILIHARNALLQEAIDSKLMYKKISLFPLIYNNINYITDEMLLTEYQILKGFKEFDMNYKKEVDEAENRINKHPINTNVFLKATRNAMGNPLSYVSLRAKNGLTYSYRIKAETIFALDYLINPETYEKAPRSLVTDKEMRYVEDEFFKKVIVENDNVKWKNKGITVMMKK